MDIGKYQKEIVPTSVYLSVMANKYILTPLIILNLLLPSDLLNQKLTNKTKRKGTEQLNSQTNKPIVKQTVPNFNYDWMTHARSVK